MGIFGINNSIGRFAGGVLTLGGFVISMAGLPLLGMAMITAGGALMASSVEKPKESEAVQRQLLNTRTSRRPLPLIYGEAEVGVNKTYYYVNNPYLHIICEIGEGQIYGIKREDGTYFTDVETQIPSSNPPLIYFDKKLWTSYNSDIVYMEFFSGTQNQTVCNTLRTATGGQWNERLMYTSYLYVRLEFDIDHFKSEPDITLVVKGLMLTDPVAATYDWSNNPVLCVYNFLTRSSQRGGLGIATTRLDLTTLETARDYCTSRGWTCNLPITEQQAGSDNLEHILACYRGAIIYSEAKFKFVYSDLAYESFTGIALTEDDVKNLVIEMPDVSHRANAVRCSYLDSTKHYQVNDYVFSSQTHITTDGDYRELSIPVYGLTRKYLVHRMAVYFLERDRARKTISFVANEKAKALEPYDLFTLTHSMPGWENKQLRVLNANIQPDDTVAISCIDEYAFLYDSEFNLTDDVYNDTDLLDPNLVQSVTGITVTETDYVHRLRTFSKLSVSFTQPANYPWWDYARIWVSTDGMTTWKHQFDTSNDFELDPVREGITYYIKIQSVNIFGTRESFDSAPVSSKFISGNYSTAPQSLSFLNASVTGNAVNIYSQKVSDPDIELYEFRLGATWSGAVFLAAYRSPNLSLSGVKPGLHTFWCNTLSANGLYGDTPRSAVVTVLSPPKGWTLSSTSGPYTNVVVNGDMELASDWSDYNTPNANSRSTGAAYEGTYGRVVENITTGSHGMQSTNMTLTLDANYGLSFWVKPSLTFVRAIVLKADGSLTADLDTVFSGLTSGVWNFCQTTFAASVGGSSARIALFTSVPSTNRYDNVMIMRGNYSSSTPYMYGSEDFIRTIHNADSSVTTYAGVYQSFYSLSSVVSGLAWIDSSYAVIGSGESWDDVFVTTGVKWNAVLNSTKTWSELFAPTESPQIKMKMVYGETTAYGSTVENMEILSAYVTGRYFGIRSCVVDPAYNIYGLVKSPTLRIAT